VGRATTKALPFHESIDTVGGMEAKLLTPDELDRLLRYPPGKSERLARRGKLPHVLLPGGDVRFDSEVVRGLLAGSACAGEGGVDNAR